MKLQLCLLSSALWSSLSSVVASADGTDNTTLLPHAVEWHNWGHNVFATFDKYLEPQNIEEVVTMLKWASSREGVKIRMLGAGHSSSPLITFDSSDVEGLRFVLSLSKMPKGIVDVKKEDNVVEVWAGTTLAELGPMLWEVGFSLPTQPAADPFTVGGVISTSSHGSNAKYSTLSSLVVGMTVVDGNGDLIEVGENDPDLGGYRQGLGLLGVMVKVQLRLTSRFFLELWQSQEKTQDLTSAPGAIFHKREYTVYMNPYGSGISTILSAQKSPSMKPPSGTSIVAPSFIVLSPFPTDFLFTEMEYFFPMQRLPNVIEEAAQMVATEGLQPFGMFLVRVAKADQQDVWLSPLSSFPTKALLDQGFNETIDEIGVIDVMEWGIDSTPGFKAAMEEIFLRHGGRPHNGKIHHHFASDWDTLEASFPRVGDFLRLRKLRDPRGIFLNSWTKGELLIDEWEKREKSKADDEDKGVVNAVE